MSRVKTHYKNVFRWINAVSRFIIPYDKVGLFFFFFLEREKIYYETMDLPTLEKISAIRAIYIQGLSHSIILTQNTKLAHALSEI